MKPRLVMFDFDGTLADSLAWLLEVFDTIADRFRFQRFDRNDLDGLRGLDFRTLMKRQRVAFWKLPFIVRHTRALMARDIDRIPLFAGVDPALARLAAGGARLAIVTSNSQGNVERVLGASVARFCALECGISILGKASKVRRLLKRLAVPPAEALFVGDEIRDAVAAREAGVPFGAVAWGYANLDALRAQGPARVFERVEDLPALLAG
jgi:phosphoglycolate phosphatase